MVYYGLSSPTTIDKPDDGCWDLRKDYISSYDTFFDYSKRPKLKGIFIYINNRNIHGLNERYLHSISIKDKEYDMYPCINDEAYIHCKTRCEVIDTPNCIANINRAFCYYRLARAKWIAEIIELANQDNENIKMWSKEFIDKTNGKKHTKRFVWYKNGLANFVIVFEEKYRDGKLNLLDFRSAYPVVVRRTEVQFEQQYNRYIKRNGHKKSPVLP